MRKKRKYKSESKITPRGGRRGCLCKDRKTYHPDCCTGEMHAQGIGRISAIASTDETLTTVTSEGLTISGLSINSSGVVTLPTATFEGTSFGTVTSVTPSSFPIVDTDTNQTVTATVTVPEGYSNSGDTISTNETVTQSATPTLSCSDITLSGFAVSDAGVITSPTIDIGTISSTSPSSFSTVSVATVRTLNVNITVPSGYFNSGATLACTTTATQPIATLSNPVTSNPFKYQFTGYPTGIVIYRFAYNNAGDFIDLKGIRGELGQSLNITISSFSKPEVVDGNATGLAMNETEDAALALIGAVMSHGGNDIQYFSETLFTTIQTGSTNVGTVYYTNNPNNTANNYGLYDSTNSIGIGVYTNLLASIPVSDATLLNQALANGYYTAYNNPKQVRIEDGVIKEVLDI